jgi:hypothetical protein
MPTMTDHVQRARINEAFANSLSPQTQAEWKVIASFYSALHYAEAVIVRSGGASSDHRTRGNYMRSLPELQLVRTNYETLANFAWDARYDPTIDLSSQQDVQAICDLLRSIKADLNF